MHALILAHQPHQVAVTLIFRELDQVPVVPLSRGHGLIRVIECRFAKWVIIPFDTGDLAGFAADAGRHVDVLADFFCPLGALRLERVPDGPRSPGFEMFVGCSFQGLFDLYQKTFEFGRVCVRIDRCWRELIRRHQ